MEEFRVHRCSSSSTTERHHGERPSRAWRTRSTERPIAAFLRCRKDLGISRGRRGPVWRVLARLSTPPNYDRRRDRAFGSPARASSNRCWRSRSSGDSASSSYGRSFSSSLATSPSSSSWAGVSSNAKLGKEPTPRLACRRRKASRFRRAGLWKNLLIIDELGFVPLSPTGAELLFEVFSQRYERGSILVTTNLPFDEWTEVFGSERLTGALLDRLTHHVHILEMNGDSYRLRHSRQGVASQVSDDPDDS